MWVDEEMIALNLRDRGWLDLAGPLWLGQTAPLGWLALQRLEKRGFIEASWGTSENNRRARFYKLTRSGRRELTREQTEWRRIASAIMRVLGAES